jgi:nicotinamidase-related amidase
MVGTAGQKKVPATTPQHPLWVENRDYAAGELQGLLRRAGEVYIEKQRFDVFTGNRNATTVIDSLLQGREDVVVYGVVTEVCVDHAITGLKNWPIRLHVPVDAIAALGTEQGKATLEKWQRWGVRLTTVAEVVEELQRNT